MIHGVIDSIEVQEKYDTNLDFLAVTMNNLSTYYIFGKLEDYIKYVDADVQFEVREDVVHGIKYEIITSLALTSIVQSVESPEDDYSTCLIPDVSKFRNVITFNKYNLKPDDVAMAQIVLVIDCKNGCSKITRWKDFTCLDVNSEMFNLRLFTNDESVDEFCKNCINHYVMVDIKLDKKYGFQVFKDMTIDETEVQMPPEVYLSSMLLSMTAKRDEALWGYIQKYDMLEHLKSLVCYEPGYNLVEMAAEIKLVNTVCSIFASYDRKLLIRAVFASRGFLLASKADLSNPLINYHRIITSTLKDDFDLIRLLDVTNPIEEGDINKQAFFAIRRMLTTIMKGRRGIHEEISFSASLLAIDAEYGGMFKRGLGQLD